MTSEDLTSTGPAPAPGSLRERKKLATRQAIVDAAWELFIEKGYAATSVDDIAAAADIAPRTFFRYFRAKDEVLYVEFEPAMERLAAEFRSRPADEPLFASLIASLDVVSSMVQDDRKMVMKRWELQREAGIAAAGESLKQRFVGLITDLVREREGDGPHAELTARIIAGTLVTCQTVANEYWLEQGADTDLHDVGSLCTRLLLEALQGHAAAATAP